MYLTPPKLFNEHGDRDWGARRLVGGNTTNMVELSNTKYDWALKVYKAMQKNFWVPSEISMGTDALDYAERLLPSERVAYHKVLSFLIFLDSLQMMNLPQIGAFLTAPEVRLCLTKQAEQEGLHAESYAYILDSVMAPEARDTVYNFWRTDERLLQRNRFITDQYERFLHRPTPRNLMRSVVANYILEGIYFYSGFAFFYALGRQRKMLGTVSQIRLIQRKDCALVA